MKVKENIARYNPMPSVSVMRSRMIDELENMDDSNFIESMYIMMIQLKTESNQRKKTKYSLTELKGIAALDEDNSKSYDDIRMDYLREKYSKCSLIFCKVLC